jgi:hypothetical protein
LIGFGERSLAVSIRREGKSPGPGKPSTRAEKKEEDAS